MAKIRLSVESDDNNTDLITTPEQIEEANDIKLADNIDELSCKIDTGLESITELLETKALLMDIAHRKSDNRLISAMESRVVGTLREVGENVGLNTDKLALETSMIHAAASKIGSLISWIRDGLIAIWKAIVKACSRIYQFVANFFKSSTGKEEAVEDIINNLNKNKEYEDILKKAEYYESKFYKANRKREDDEREEYWRREKNIKRYSTDQPEDNFGHYKQTKYDKGLDNSIVDVVDKRTPALGYSHEDFTHLVRSVEDFSNAIFSSAPTNSYMYLGKRGEKRFLDANEARLDQLLSFAQEKLCVSTSHGYRNLIGKIYDLFHDLHFGNDLIPKDLKHYLDNSDSYDSKLASYREKVADKLEDIHGIQGKLINDIVGKDFMDSNIKVSRVTNSRYFNSFEFTFSGFDEKDLNNVNTLDPNTFKTLLDTINKNINIFKFTSSDKIVELLYDKSLDLTQKIEDTITKFSRTVDEKSLEGGSIDASVHKLSKYAHSLNDILVEAVKKLNTLINEIFKQHKATSTLLLGIVKAFRATVDYSLETTRTLESNYHAKRADGNPLYK